MARSLERLRTQYAAKPEELLKMQKGGGPRGGPPGRGATGKPKNMGPTIRRLMKYVGRYWYRLVLVLLCMLTATVTSLCGGYLMALHAVGVGADEGCTLDFGGTAIFKRLAAAAALGTHQDVVEHCRESDIVASAETYSFRTDRIAIAIGEFIEVASNHYVKRVAANLSVHPVLKGIPSTASSIEPGRKLRRDIGIEEDVHVCLFRRSPLRRAQHMPLVATTSCRF